MMSNILIILFDERDCFKLCLVCMFLGKKLLLEILEEGRPIVFLDLREAIIPIRGSTCEGTPKKGHAS